MKQVPKSHTAEWRESERKRKAEYDRTAKQKRQQQQNRRAEPGRRARQVNGMLVPVKAEVPRAGAVCDRCGGRTVREPGDDGRRECHRCRPSKQPVARSGPRVYGKPKNRKVRPVPKLLPGRVHRLCIVCDVKLQKMPDECGPFMCHRCKDRWRNRGATNHIAGTRDKRVEGEADCPVRAARVDRLADLYAEVEKYPTEREARKAGVPTMLEEFKLMPAEVRTRDEAASDDAEDEDDAS